MNRALQFFECPTFAFSLFPRFDLQGNHPKGLKDFAIFFAPLDCEIIFDSDALLLLISSNSSSSSLLHSKKVEVFFTVQIVKEKNARTKLQRSSLPKPGTYGCLTFSLLKPVKSPFH